MSSTTTNSPLIAIGVLTMLRSARQFSREQMRSTWMRLVDDTIVRIKFVAKCESAPPGFVCTDVELEHPKAIAWFARAIELFPRTPWVGHCDDDVYLNTRHVLRDLLLLPTVGEAYGLVNIMKAWKSGPRSDMFDGHLEQWGPRPHGVRNGRYPFMQGGFYALTRDLVMMLLPLANRTWTVHQQVIRKHGLGEDGLLFYALHAAAAAARVPYTLRHLTWTRYHYMPRRPLEAPAGGMGWVAPSASSTCIHWMKYAGAMHWQLAHNVTAAADAPPFAPFRFVWDAARGRFGRDPSEGAPTSDGPSHKTSSSASDRAASAAGNGAISDTLSNSSNSSNSFSSSTAISGASGGGQRAEGGRWLAYLIACGPWGRHDPHRGCALDDFTAIATRTSRESYATVQPLLRSPRATADSQAVQNWRMRVAAARGGLLPAHLADCLLRVAEADLVRLRALCAEAADKGEWRLMCLHWQREQRMRNRTAAAKVVGDSPVSLSV